MKEVGGDDVSFPSLNLLAFAAAMVAEQGLKPNPLLVLLALAAEYVKNKDVMDMDFEADSSYSLMNCTHIAFKGPLSVTHEVGFLLYLFGQP